jgi:Virulence factor BrkB
VVQRVWAESSRDNLSVIAAGCAFYALFAIFPTLSALISFYGLTADPATIELQLGMFALVLPPQGMLVEQTHHIAAASGTTLGWSFVVSVGSLVERHGTDPSHFLGPQYRLRGTRTTQFAPLLSERLHFYCRGHFGAAW